MQKSNSELEGMSITGCQRQKIHMLIESQFEEMFQHYKKRHEETMQIEKEELEKRISIINEELQEIEKTKEEPTEEPKEEETKEVLSPKMCTLF